MSSRKVSSTGSARGPLPAARSPLIRYSAARLQLSAAHTSVQGSGHMAQPPSSAAGSALPVAEQRSSWWWLRPFHSMSWGAPRQQSGLVGWLFNSSTAAAPTEQASVAVPGPTHLVVLVNGLFGSSANWDVICEQLQQHLDPQHTLLHASTANSRFSTYDGIDVCGGRLAAEVRGVVAGQAHLTRITIVAHSMGGLMARYAIGMLYNPANRTICGLQPAHFVTLATPHCGCDADGVAQVPFIGWTGGLPLLGQQLFRFLRDISGPTAALLFRRTGQQFFMLDGKQQQQQQQLAGAQQQSPSSGSNTADLPVLLQLTQDCPDRGLYFYSGLSAFKTRTAYANTDGDHLVGFANSSMRSLAALPPLPPAAATAKGVVLEDPLSAAFFPHSWQQLQQHWQQQQQAEAAEESAIAAAAAVDSSVQQAITQPYQASRVWQSSVSAPGAAVGSATTSTAPAAWHELQRGGRSNKEGPLAPGWRVPVQQQQQRQSLSTVAVLELEAAGAAAAATEAVADLFTPPAEAAPVPAGRPAAAGQPSLRGGLDSGDEVLQLEASGLAASMLSAAAMQAGSSSGSSRETDGVPAAAAAAAEQDLASGLSGAGIAAAASRHAAVDAVAADVAQLAQQLDSTSRAQAVAHMLYRLQELPWRRIDVSFQGARFGFAHNNIQVTRRWMNFEGIAIPRHLAQQLQLMEALVAEGGSWDAQASTAGPPAVLERESRTSS